MCGDEADSMWDREMTQEGYESALPRNEFECVNCETPLSSGGGGYFFCIVCGYEKWPKGRIKR